MSTQQAGAPRELLADRAYVQLRDLIITLRIRPGDPIDEDRLGEALQMGRTPVREAVKRLALENLVTVFPRRGTFASDINITDLTHISEVRVVLEAHAAYRAAERITDAQRAELAELLDELSRSQGSDDWTPACIGSSIAVPAIRTSRRRWAATSTSRFASGTW